MLKIAFMVVAGALVGAVLGYVGKCTTGTCPFTANPLRGAGFGALVGLMFGISGGVLAPRREPAEESGAILRVAGAAELDRLLAEATIPVLVDFYADWCGPCRRLAPEISALADAWNGKAVVIKINVDREREIAARYGVKSIPDMRVFKNGSEVEKIIGYRSRDQLDAVLRRITEERRIIVTEQLRKGDPAPAFNLKDQDGNSVSTESLKGRKVLLYFYPKADTPGCTKQSCAVSTAQAVLEKAGVAAIGISPDGPADQKKFDEKHQLGFPLLADTDHAVAEAFGVWGEKSMYGKTYFGVLRSSFLLDEHGRVIEAWYKVSPDDTVPLALQALGLE